jgi:hypothetical protein
VAKYGLNHPATLPTSSLIKMVHDLVCHGEFFFTHHHARTHPGLELHLRCIIAALRLLLLHKLDETTLSTEFINELHDGLSWWKSFHLEQIGFDLKRSAEEKANNYTVGFLIYHIEDLISSTAAARSLLSNLADRIATVSAAVDNSVRLSVIFTNDRHPRL